MADEPRVALARIKERARLESIGEEEDSVVIEQRAKESVSKESGSVPAPAKGIVAVLSVIPAWQRGIVLLALLGLIGYAVGHGFKFW